MIEVILTLIWCITMLAWFHSIQQFEKERGGWKDERQQLLDRIQAPSFDHLKQAEVKIIKAQNEPKETIKLEVV